MTCSPELVCGQFHEIQVKNFHSFYLLNFIIQVRFLSPYFEEEKIFFQTTVATKLSEDFVKGPSISLSSKMRRLRTTQLLARLFSEAAAAVLSDFDDLKNQDIIWRLLYIY